MSGDDLSTPRVLVLQVEARLDARVGQRELRRLDIAAQQELVVVLQVDADPLDRLRLELQPYATEVERKGLLGRHHGARPREEVEVVAGEIPRAVVGRLRDGDLRRAECDNRADRCAQTPRHGYVCRRAFTGSSRAACAAGYTDASRLPTSRMRPGTRMLTQIRRG